MNKVFIIAEAGVNHNGSVKIAKKMIDAAARSGADAVKFQSFCAEKLAIANAPKAKYQCKTTSTNQTQKEMLKKLELTDIEQGQLAAYCRRKGIMFMSSPFDILSLRTLQRLEMGIIKIPSGEINNLPLLRDIGKLRKQVFLSTGMSDLTEISAALKVLTEAGTNRKNITVLHCHTEYPTLAQDVNLRAMLTIGQKLAVKIVYSDHTLGYEIPIAAVALGATVVEKHFTLDRNMPGPDQRASLEPSELKAMVLAIKNIEKALGDGIKKPSRAEIRNMRVVRKSIVAVRNINQGEQFTEENLATKRPGTGLSPMLWDKVVGKLARKKFSKDELISI
ncbi:MAG: N-acetylneuraminate synthase [bacterium]|nr:N-acetylneuraminate synthase [bacterium]